MLQELKRLHDLGLALHWLHPKSKRPIKTGWTKGPRLSYEELKTEYKPNLNIGVRLGEASKIGSGYLAVIDCDMKSDDPKHVAEMNKKLLELFPILGKQRTPEVLSGRGNGSKHLYTVTSLPIGTKRMSQSCEKVLVPMPSVSPSNFEKKELTPEQIEKGLRLRAAWEISLMGEGSQVVLPPSVHPDSGQRYKWIVKMRTVSDFVPLEDLPETEKKIPKNETEFKVEKYDLTHVDPQMVELLKTGEGSCGDRSEDVYHIIEAMLKVGFNDNQIATALTDLEFEMAEVAYRHAHTQDRRRAAQWILRENVPKARKKFDPKIQFEKEVVTETLENEEAEKQKEELTERDWTHRLDRTAIEKGGFIKQTQKNLVLIYENYFGKPLFKFNAFSNRELFALDTPWGTKENEIVSDNTLLEVRQYLAEHLRFEPNKDILNDAANLVARRNSFHPVQDYLNTLDWDGIPRIDTWLRDYLGSRENLSYLKIVGSKFLIAICARVFEPGCKFDHILILEGKQGLGKSSAAEILAGKDWFTDHLPDLRDKDARLNLCGSLIIEMSELLAVKRSETELIKSFLTTTVDKVRAPYGRRMEDYKRQSVFIGSTNDTEYLKDKTGNRRYWPVAVNDLNRKKLEKDRDQLFAEARFRYELGEVIWLTKDESKICEKEQEKRTIEGVEDEMADKILADMKDKKRENKIDYDRFRMSELFDDFGPLAKWGHSTYRYQNAATALRKIGVERYERMGRSFWRKT